MTRFHKYDTRILLQRFVTTTDPIGSPIQTWVNLADVAAEAKNVQAEERVEASQLVGKNRMRFAFRWSPNVRDVGSGDGVIWNGRAYNALEVFFIPAGRPERIEIVAEARTD